MELGYNFAEVKVRDTRDAVRLMHFLMYDRQHEIGDNQEANRKFKELLRSEINQQLNDASKNPIEAALIFSANFHEYSQEELVKLSDSIYYDLKEYNKRNKKS